MKSGYGCIDNINFEIDDPISNLDLMGRIAYARDHNRIAVFVKTNGDVWAIFADTVLGQKYIKQPIEGSELVGCFCNTDYVHVYDKIRLKIKEFRRLA